MKISQLYSDKTHSIKVQPRPNILIDGKLFETIQKIALNKHPKEICGVLRGDVHKDFIHIIDARVCENMARYKVKGFRLKLKSVKMNIHKWSTQDQDFIWGIFHSHTHVSAKPSKTDLKMMRKFAGLHLIISNVGKARVFISSKYIMECQLKTRKIIL